MTMYGITTIIDGKEMYYCQHGDRRWLECDPYYDEGPEMALMTKSDMLEALRQLSLIKKLRVTVLSFEVPFGSFIVSDKNAKAVYEELLKI